MNRSAKTPAAAAASVTKGRSGRLADEWAGEVAWLLWRHTHAYGHARAHAAVTAVVAAAALTATIDPATRGNPGARHCLRELEAAARDAQRLRARDYTDGPTDAADRARAQAGDPVPSRAAAAAAWADCHRAGVVSGVLEAATDTLVAWRGRVGAGRIAVPTLRACPPPGGPLRYWPESTR